MSDEEQKKPGWFYGTEQLYVINAWGLHRERVISEQFRGSDAFAEADTLWQLIKGRQDLYELHFTRLDNGQFVFVPGGCIERARPEPDDSDEDMRL